MKLLESLNRYINKALVILGGISVLALMTLATANVVLRIFHLPFRGTYEIVAFLGAVVIAFSLGFTQKTKSNIVVDILSERFPPAVAGFLDKLANLVIMVFFVIVAWQVYVYGMKIYESHEVSETLKVIFYPFVFMVSIGFAALSFTGFVDFLKGLTRMEDRS
ncbi:MAG: Tripartite ATP-independent periplasmic transporter [Syntrophorhabdaceae bacterium PtaU1.Bin034]|nr:MAG: Tripartite ATP-independent periplasmic transporter [Syntrophorhabdaceae bacterium PtaU1.Bin034]